MIKISFVFGTRPEAIKLAPLIKRALKEDWLTVNICVTAQHREMLDDVLQAFNIVPDIDMNLMVPNQNLSELTSKAIKELHKYFSDSKPDLLIVQGDTVTVFSAALAAFYEKIKIAHVEAGLRTWKKYSPFPEEISRQLTTKITDYHFAPTITAKKNLLLEQVDEQKIFVTGNTVVDALLDVEDKLRNGHVLTAVPDDVLNSKYILVTMHRRENYGQGIRNVCEAIIDLAACYGDISFIYPVHPNPNVNDQVRKLLTGYKNIYLTSPLNYLQFLKLLRSSYLVLTDSGGVQEEAPTFNVPVFVLRDYTERMESVKSGTSRVIGTRKEDILEAAALLLSSPDEHKKMTGNYNPFGDGKASERILGIIKENFC